MTRHTSPPCLCSSSPHAVSLILTVEEAVAVRLALERACRELQAITGCEHLARLITPVHERLREQIEKRHRTASSTPNTIKGEATNEGETL
ncbi:hypothetical protein MYX04_12485 [Nitrospiraceae bacterium AH_259_D15_M11_P09]|nr:hypothetical protein [Nitrospiraceae bacterium AH_259_D15_M11_P09]